MEEYYTDVPGMRVFEEVITPEMEQMIIQAVENPDDDVHVQPSRPNFTVWEYGWIYFDTLAGRVYDINVSRRTKDIPFVLLELFRRVEYYLRRVGVDTDFTLDHCMVNRYVPGEGIYSHVDDLNYWGNWVVGVCIGSGATMIMTAPGGEKKSVYLFPRSIYILEGLARTSWKHEIPARDYDTVGGVQIPRSVRYAITYREIKILNDELRAEYQEYPKFLNNI